MSGHSVIVIGGSTGALAPLTVLLERLPHDLPAALFVVLHVAPESDGSLARALDRRSSLPVRLAEHQRALEAGTVHLARPDHHLLVDEERMLLSSGPRENRVRPAIDPLFRSAALAHGPRVVGVLLSGLLDDGAAGLVSIKKRGGQVMLQDPTSAVASDMPRAAAELVEVDWCGAPEQMARGLQTLLAGRGAAPREGDGAPDDVLVCEVEIARKGAGLIRDAIENGEPVPASCPECGGPMWRLPGALARFRCHTGHAYTARHLVRGLEEAEERSLWAALRVMEERVRMLTHMARKNGDRGLNRSGRRYQDQAREAAEHVRQIRRLLGAEAPVESSRPRRSEQGSEEPKEHDADEQTRSCSTEPGPAD
jgi:two-component system, chemotaxis family, protein-glutamate methylesterase/glutaminase